MKLLNMQYPKISNRETAYKGFHSVEKVTLKTEHETLEREIYRNKNSVAALVFNTEKKEFILVEQYRLAAEKPLQEIVAGLLDHEGESAVETIKREILEETGFETDKLEKINEFYTSPGAVAEKMELFYAEVSRQTGAGGGVASENETLKTVVFSKEKLLATKFEDAKTLIAVLWLKSQAQH
jgi:ADP-ribose pyrophosphatase